MHALNTVLQLLFLVQTCNLLYKLNLDLHFADINFVVSFLGAMYMGYEDFFCENLHLTLLGHLPLSLNYSL